MHLKFHLVSHGSRTHNTWEGLEPQVTNIETAMHMCSDPLIAFLYLKVVMSRLAS